MKLKIEIDLDNDIFLDDGFLNLSEVRTVTKMANDKLMDNAIGTKTNIVLYDSNGNRCGYLRIMDGNVKA